MKKFKPYWVLIISTLLLLILWVRYIGPYLIENQILLPMHPAVGWIIVIYYAITYSILVIYNRWYLNKYGLY